MVIKETGTQAKQFPKNNGTGDFILGENTQGYYDTQSNGFQYPGVDAEADFRGYNLFGVNLTVTAPVYGTNGVTKTFPRMNMTTSYNTSFNSSGDQLHILITQNGRPTSTIVAKYTVTSSSGAALHVVTQTWHFPSNDSNPPPYVNYGVSDLVHGLEKHGYANVLSGTDLRIESVIHPDVTDFTGYEALQYNGSQLQFTVPPMGGPCFSSYPEDEGTNESLSSTSITGTVPGSNEAYQYAAINTLTTEQTFVSPNRAITVPVTINGVVHNIYGGVGGGLNANVYVGNNKFSVPMTVGTYTFKWFYVVTPGGSTTYYTNVAEIVLPSGLTPQNSLIQIAYG